MIVKSDGKYSVRSLDKIEYVDSVQVSGSTLTVKGWSNRQETVFDEKTGRSNVLTRKDQVTIKLTSSEDGKKLTGTSRLDMDVNSGGGKYRVYSVTARRAD